MFWLRNKKKIFSYTFLSGGLESVVRLSFWPPESLLNEYHFSCFSFQFSACKRKLDSKCEALLILSQELDQCRSERDQFKLMAEQLRERYQSLKKQLSGQVESLWGVIVDIHVKVIHVQAIILIIVPYLP